MTTNDHTPRCVLVVGDDPLLRMKALGDVLSLLPDSGGRNEFSGEYLLTEVALAASTPSLLADRRVVVTRDTEAFKGELGPLVEYLSDPNPDATLVIEWPERTAPKELLAAVSTAGGKVHQAAAPRTANDRGKVVNEVLRSSRVRLDGAARKAVLDRLGEDVQQLSPLLERLESAWGSEGTIGLDQLEGYLPSAGGAPPWAVDDAIDNADPAAALVALHRLLGSGRHPLAVLKMLTTRFERAYTLASTGDETVGDLDSLPAPALRSARKLARRGADVLAGNLELLAAARGDLTGNSSWPDHLVLEVLVARLATRRRVTTNR
jgi:DNA polymerase III delta subunit